jgi:anaerobic selenocysteine-containing dehydrogenase
MNRPEDKKRMASEKVKTYCRFCHAYCPMVAEVEDNRLINNLDHPEKYSGMARQSAIAIKLCKTG